MALRTTGFGESHYRSVLTEEIVREARRLHREGMSYVKIADLCGVTTGTIQQAIKGVTWKQVDGPISDRFKYKTKGVGMHITKEGLDKMTELHKAGYSISKIGAMMKISDGTVRKYIRREFPDAIKPYRRSK